LTVKNSTPVLCLTGPTAAGKTRIALELARYHDFEIISVDSALVYRGMDIGSGKPDRQTLTEIPHHLVDIRDPSEPYSAADFRLDAINAADTIIQAGKRPLFVGGTMLYFKVLSSGLATMPAANPQAREKILALASDIGWSGVHQRLAEIDPEAARRIHPNDPQRLMRALEVFETTGKTLTAYHQAGNSMANPLPDFLSNLVFVAIHPAERAVLHEQIARRFHAMLAAGFVEEVQALHARTDLDRDLPAMRAVGYRQIWDYLDRRYDRQTMTAKGIAATRQLAKRQLTWLRSWPQLHRIETEMGSESENIVNKCLKILKQAAINWL
jgi:tRNA dimethylallyltransferase